MSYHIYTTDGIILKRMVFGEANVLLYVLTQDLGLVVASAQSARLSVSKLAPSLQEYSYGSVSCIKGKNGWKITNATEKENFFFDSPQYVHVVMAKIIALLVKMIPGEEVHPEIFHIVFEGFTFLKSVPEKDTMYFEIVIVLRILYELGYVVKNEVTEYFLLDPVFWSVDTLREVSHKKDILVGIINKALSESHL